MYLLSTTKLIRSGFHRRPFSCIAIKSKEEEITHEECTGDYDEQKIYMTSSLNCEHIIQ